MLQLLQQMSLVYKVYQVTRLWDDPFFLNNSSEETNATSTKSVVDYIHFLDAACLTELLDGYEL